jgi:hypothetical protein
MPQFWFFVKVAAIAIAVTSLPELWSIVRKVFGPVVHEIFHREN